jgi:hypothetical protein
MQVDPVELRQVRVEDVVVPDLLVLDPRVGERERHRIVPGGRIGGRVDRDARRLLERHRVHVPLADHLANGRDGAAVHRLEGHARERGRAPQARQVGHEEGPTAIVEQPLAADVVRERAEDDAVGLEMIGLGVVHRHEQVLGAHRRGHCREGEADGEARRGGPREMPRQVPRGGAREGAGEGARDPHA